MKDDRIGVTLGAIAGLVGIACCVGPTALALVGLASVSFALSLGNTLYYEYGWYFRAAAVALAVASVVQILRERKACTLRGARASWRLFAVTGVTMIAVYVTLYALTSWLATLATTR
jgi:hypothetical protein